VSGSHLLVAVGRRPETGGMELEEVGVTLGKQKQVVTDAYLRTSAGHIFAAGDCTTPCSSRTWGTSRVVSPPATPSPPAGSARASRAG
jgi:pyruvate/2-oxoglutarate dehydrogenase complex dihydrolipoamide dehydrogenase (E3) component